MFLPLFDSKEEYSWESLHKCHNAHNFYSALTCATFFKYSGLVLCWLVHITGSWLQWNMAFGGDQVDDKTAFLIPMPLSNATSLGFCCKKHSSISLCCNGNKVGMESWIIAVASTVATLFSQLFAIILWKLLQKCWVVEQLSAVEGLIQPALISSGFCFSYSWESKNKTPREVSLSPCMLGPTTSCFFKVPPL